MLSSSSESSLASVVVDESVSCSSSSSSSGLGGSLRGPSRSTSLQEEKSILVYLSDGHGKEVNNIP